MTETEREVIEALRQDGLCVSSSFNGFLISCYGTGMKLDCLDCDYDACEGYKIASDGTLLDFFSIGGMKNLKDSPNYPLYMAYVLGNRNEE